MTKLKPTMAKPQVAAGSRADQLFRQYEADLQKLPQDLADTLLHGTVERLAKGTTQEHSAATLLAASKDARWHAMRLEAQGAPDRLVHVTPHRMVVVPPTAAPSKRPAAKPRRPDAPRVASSRPRGVATNNVDTRADTREFAAGVHQERQRFRDERAREAGAWAERKRLRERREFAARVRPGAEAAADARAFLANLNERAEQQRYERRQRLAHALGRGGRR